MLATFADLYGRTSIRGAFVPQLSEIIPTHGLQTAVGFEVKAVISPAATELIALIDLHGSVPVNGRPVLVQNYYNPWPTNCRRFHVKTMISSCRNRTDAPIDLYGRISIGGANPPIVRNYSSNTNFRRFWRKDYDKFLPQPNYAPVD